MGQIVDFLTRWEPYQHTTEAAIWKYFIEAQSHTTSFLKEPISGLHVNVAAEYSCLQAVSVCRIMEWLGQSEH